MIVAFKVCTRCKKTKPLGCFGVNNALKSKISSACIECNRLSCKSYRQKNHEKEKRRGADWFSKNPDYKKKYRELNKDRIKLTDNLWKESNRGKFNSARSRQRAIKLQRMPVWADPIKIEEVYLLAKEQEKKTGIPHHVDHVIPLKGKNVSGLHLAENLQILTAKQNLAKRNYYVGG